MFGTESPVSVTCILIKGGTPQLKEVLHRVDYRSKGNPNNRKNRKNRKNPKNPLDGGDESMCSFAGSGHHRTHTMVVKGSGGAADVIAYGWMMEDEGEGDEEGLMYELSSQLGIHAKHKALQAQALLMVKTIVKLGRRCGTLQVGTKVKGVGTKVEGVGTKVKGVGTKVKGAGTKGKGVGTKVKGVACCRSVQCTSPRPHFGGV